VLMVLCVSIFVIGCDQHRGMPNKGKGGATEGERRPCCYEGVGTVEGSTCIEGHGGG